MRTKSTKKGTKFLIFKSKQCILLMFYMQFKWFDKKVNEWNCFFRAQCIFVCHYVELKL